jgi:hypothetical protein
MTHEDPEFTRAKTPRTPSSEFFSLQPLRPSQDMPWSLRDTVRLLIAAQPPQVVVVKA